jgi:hypothetical protein
LTKEATAMGKSKLRIICGLKVIDALWTDGDSGISFENGISLAIYNRYILEGFDLSEANSLIGKIVTSIDEAADTTTIRFGNDWAILIDMRDEAYTGPEAMQLRIPGESIVIWN